MEEKIQQQNIHYNSDLSLSFSRFTLQNFYKTTKQTLIAKGDGE